MKIIIRSRQSGKTLELIKAADNCNGYIVCIDHREAVRVSRLAKEIGCDINFPLTPEEFISGAYSGGTKCLYLDNADLLLQRIAKVPIEAISITKEFGFRQPGNSGKGVG